MSNPRRPPVRHQVVHTDAAFYCAHPHLAVAADGTWVLVFNKAPAREVILHPPLDPAFRNVVMRSADEGRTWTAPEPVPDPATSGVECAGLTALPDGSVLLNQWQFGWGHPASFAAAAALIEPHELARQWAVSTEFSGLHEPLSPDAEAELFPLARCGGRCLVSRAANGAAPFLPVATIATQPFAGGYGMRGGLPLAGGDVLLPLSDVPHYAQVFVVRIAPDGSVGAPVLAAAMANREFEEPAPLRLADGAILLVLRENVTRTLHAVRSDDDGATWSRPWSVGITDYPAHLLRLFDGRIATVAGRRTPPYGITLFLSADERASWAGPILVRDLPDRDLGYPVAAQRAEGDLVVVYYGRGPAGATAILSSVVAIPPVQGIES